MLEPSFPRVRHLPTSQVGPDDITWGDDDARRFFDAELVVVEKLDGIGVTLARGPRGTIAFGLRPMWRHPDVVRGLRTFCALRRDALWPLVQRGAHVHGEWMRHVVSLRYRALPDVFVATGIRARGAFVDDLAAYDAFAQRGLATNTPLYVGRLRDVDEAVALVRTSQYGARRMEGLILARRRDRTEARFAKWVGPWYRETRRVDGAKNETAP